MDSTTFPTNSVTKSSMKRVPAMIRRPTPFAIRHECTCVGEDSLLLTFLHNAGFHCRILRLRLGTGLADVPEHAVIFSTRYNGFLDSDLLSLDRVAGSLLLRCRAYRFSLSSDTRGEGRSG